MRLRLMFLLAALSGLIPMCTAQTKTLHLNRPLNDDPVRLIKVTAGTTEIVSDGTAFPDKHSWQGTVPNGGDDWLTSLSLTIQNVSTKKIVYLNVWCSVTETADWKLEHDKHSVVQNALQGKTAEPILGQLNHSVGHRPKAALYSMLTGHELHPDSGPAFELAPGQTYTIALEDPAIYGGLKSSVEESKGSISAANACNGPGVGIVFFEDGTQWQGHRYLRADPDTRGHWITITRDEWLNVKPEPEAKQ
jgi:hypothetical protein